MKQTTTILAISALLAISASVAVLIQQGSPAKPASQDFVFQPKEALAQEYTVKQEHPRIWLTPERLATLKARAAANTPEWVMLKNFVDAFLDQDTGLWTTYHYALAYLITGEEQYATKALKIVEEDILPYNMIDPYYARTYGVELAVAYDWLYDHLSADDKVRWYTKMNEWTEFVLSSWAKNDVHSNYFYGLILSSGLTGIATYGDNPLAEQWFNTIRYDKYENLIKKALTTDYKDGGWIYEGSDYSSGSYTYILEYLWALKTSTGEDLFRDTPCPENIIYNSIYVTQPTLDRVLPTGDWAGEDTLGWIRDSRRILMLILAKPFQGSVSGEYAQWYLNHNHRRTSMTENRYKWYDFFWYDPGAPERNINDLPLFRFDQGTGWVYARSDWGENATYAAFHCGALKTRAGHEHYDQNSFFIFKNSWLAAPGNVAAKGWIDGDTVDYNTIVVNVNGEDKNQAGNRDWRPVIERFEQNNDYVYSLGQAVGAYHDSIYNRIYLDNFERQFIYLKPDYVIVFDRVRTSNAAYYPKWLLKFINEPTISGNLTTAINGQDKLFVETLLPANFTINKVFGTGGNPNGWSIHLTDNDQSDQDYLFLNVVQATNSSVSSMISTEQINSATNNMVGAKLDISANDARVVMFSKTETNQSNVTYALTASSQTIKHLIADLQPNFNYNIYQDGNLLTSKTSSNSGTLFFTSQGASTFQITQGTYVPPKTCQEQGGVCQANACNTYDNCSSASGACAFGYCCSGACAEKPAPTPNITLTKQADKQEASAGEEITYTITYNNTGTAEARDVVITDTIPAGATYVAGSATGNPSCNPLACSGQATLTWTIPTLSAGGSGSVSFKAKVD